MSISKNLQTLRLSKGMTQEEVAQQLGLTRQAISNYESGRTRPDIGTLMRMAQIYETDLDSVLYGTSKEQKAIQTVKTAAFVVLTLVLLLTLLCSLLLWFTDIFCQISTGQVSAEQLPLVELRFSLLHAHTLLDGVTSTVSLIGLVLLLAFSLRVERPIPIRSKLLFLAILCAGTALLTIPFALCDRVYSMADYVLSPLYRLSQALLLFLFSVIFDLIRNWRRRRKSAAA